MEAKLQEKLALRRKKREESEREDQKAFQVLKNQQEEMIQKVIQTQADLTEELVILLVNGLTHFGLHCNNRNGTMHRFLFYGSFEQDWTLMLKTLIQNKGWKSGST